MIPILMFWIGVGAGVFGVWAYREFTDPANQLRRAEEQLARITAREQFEAEQHARGRAELDQRLRAEADQRAKDKAFLEQRLRTLREKNSPPRA